MFLSRNNDYESIPLVAYNDDCYDVAYMAHFADNVFYKPAKKNVSMSHITGGRIPDVFYLVQG